MNKNQKILIIGAGPSGLSAALRFATKGIIPTVVEKRSNTSTLSRAVGIMPETLAKLGQNISKKILEESMPFMKINMHVDTNRVLNLDLNGKVEETEVLTGLPQDRTEEIIKEELNRLGIPIDYASEVSDIELKEKSVDVYFNNEKKARNFDWVIACDGVNSTTRNKLEIDFPGFELEDDWSIADIELSGNSFDYAANNVWMKIGKNYEAVVSLPIGMNRIRLISTTEDCLETIPLDLSISKMHRKGKFKVSVRQIKSYKKGRVLFAGDSAHCHSPVGGKGMNLGIGDAMAAADAIINGTTETYSKERHSIGSKVIKESETLRKMIMNKSPILKFMISSVFAMINKSSILQKLAMKRISKL